MTNQPQWKRIANLGDAHPLSYGGYFVFVDETGEYAPEAEVLDVNNEHETDDDKLTYTVHRFSLHQCTFINGILSDNPYHKATAAWFAPKNTIECESRYNITLDEFAKLLTSDNPLERAEAYREIGEYHGWDNFDHYPLRLTRAEAVERYKGETI
jgi:hypothetical protein